MLPMDYTLKVNNQLSKNIQLAVNKYLEKGGMITVLPYQTDEGFGNKMFNANMLATEGNDSSDIPLLSEDEETSSPYPY